MRSADSKATPVPLSQRKVDALLDDVRARLDAVRGTPDRVGRLLEAVLSVGSELDLERVLRRTTREAADLLDARYAALGVVALVAFFFVAQTWLAGMLVPTTTQFSDAAANNAFFDIVQKVSSHGWQIAFFAMNALAVGIANAWTRAIDRAGAAGQPATVVVLAAVGMQTGDWRGVPAESLFHICAALARVGLDGEARMIAAEAIAWMTSKDSIRAHVRNGFPIAPRFSTSAAFSPSCAALMAQT